MSTEPYSSHEPETETEMIQQFCAEGALSNCIAELDRHDVGMNKDGSLVYFAVFNRRTEVKMLRKNLVLGLDGFDQHDLSEANQVLSGAVGLSAKGIEEFVRQQVS